MKKAQIDKIVKKQHSCGEFCKQFTKNFKSAWKVLMSLGYVFVVTLTVFPGTFFTSHFTFMDGMSTQGAEFTWYTLIVILTFNILDTVGRKMGGMMEVPSGVVYTLSLIRTAFVVSTIMIAQKEGVSGFANSDAFKIINLILFAWSNGFVSTCCAIQAPRFVENDQKEQVGIFVGLFIIIGITIGSIIAMPIGSHIHSDYWHLG